MKIYEFGKENKTTIICLPGNFMTHRQFDNIVPLNKYIINNKEQNLWAITT